MCQTFQKDQSFGTKVIAQKPVCLQTDHTKPTDVDTIDGCQVTAIVHMTTWVR